MKKVFLTRWLLAGLAICSLPLALLAQPEKGGKGKTQQIVITRSGDKEEKTVVEIDGDKIRVNGKDVADLKDIKVNIRTLTNPDGFAITGPGDNRFSMTFGDDGPLNNLFKEDANRAMLGVNTTNNEKGAELSSVVKGSAAEKAGLKKGDIITKIGNDKISNLKGVTESIRGHKPGDKVTITYLRDGKEQKSTAELDKWKGVRMEQITMHRDLTDAYQEAQREFQTNPHLRSLHDSTQRHQLNGYLQDRINMAIPRMPRIPRVNFEMDGPPRLGLQVQDTDDGKGVKVLDADADSNAGKAGIKEDDIITMVDDMAVNSADELADAMRMKKDKTSVTFKLTRGGKAQTVEVKVPRRIKTVDL